VSIPIKTHSISEKLIKTPGEGVLLGSFGGGVPPASPNPDPISDQRMPFPIPVFRPGLKSIPGFRPDLVRD